MMLPGRHKNSNHSRVFAAASPLLQPTPLIYRWAVGKIEERWASQPPQLTPRINAKSFSRKTLDGDKEEEEEEGPK